MRQNSFNDSIPTELFHLRFLQFFDSSTNSLEGGLSSEVGKLENLRTLNLDGNLLGGNLRNNQLLKQIPSEIGILSYLSTLALSKNSFTGVIPPSILNLSNLEKLQLDDNKLYGEIPAWLFDMEGIKKLYLGGNEMNWNNNVKIVPKCLLSQLSLKSCKIAGDIPEWISTQKNIDFLELSDNQVTGRFQFGLLRWKLEVYYCQIT
ncbi:hypothetical protein POM88_050335 [Heracleum sosnowskyi]|uniref:Uncharacterized protein n=1 Tax=Heracleum sosnowskyi TaxID=360622 RepID=A0AAD8M298_9APIA|nr:hypothetical protein POM88_050335 [Heracleum sosnowskyi]